HIEELVLDNASLTRVSFSGVTVDKLSLRGATSRDVDLRGLDFAGIEGVESMKGVTVSSLQTTEMAHLFARHLGISVLG
ncbi:MAG: pentapeptide repeat-containing protein, partial [Microbacteriaceae bacterium]